MTSAPAEADLTAYAAALVPGHPASTSAAAALSWHRAHAADLPWPGEDTESARDLGTLPLRAARALAHRYLDPHFVNIPEVPLGDPIDWTFQPYPPGHPHFAPSFATNVSRHTWWPDLAEAYSKTGDEIFAHEWAAQLRDWITRNPPPSPPNIWTDVHAWKGLNVGIRLFATWPAVYQAFLSSPVMTPALHEAFATSCLTHARYLHTCMTECPSQEGNWVVMQCRGLLTAALLFPEWADSASFVAYAVGRLEEELFRQVYADGGQTELSPAYHQRTLTDFIRVVEIFRAHRRPVPASFVSRVHAMARWLHAIVEPGGLVPILGDSARRDARPLLALCARVLDDPALLRPASGPAWLDHSGYAVFRSGPAPDAVHAVFDAGPIGTGHWHEDMLSLYIVHHGRPVLTEGGKCAYDESTERFRSLLTPAHNTLVLDGKSQHRGFWFPEPVKFPPSHAPVPALWRDEGRLQRCRATYDAGYESVSHVTGNADRLWRWRGDLDTSARHTREVVFVDNTFFLVADSLDGAGSHTADVLWHVDAPDGPAPAHGLLVLPILDIDLHATLHRGETDAGLGMIHWEGVPRAITAHRHRRTGPLPHRFLTLLWPWTNHAPALRVIPLSPSSWQLNVPDRTFTFSLSPDGSITA